MEENYTRRLLKIEAVLNKWLPEKPDPAWFSMVFGQVPISPELAASLTQPGWDLVNRGGKRWRPLLSVLIAETIAGDEAGEAVLPLVPLVEFPHNASLIHDDIEDNSDERRGKPTIHLIYGNDTAINSGAFLYFLPLACLSAWTEDYHSAYAEGHNKDNKVLLLAERIWTTWASHMRALHLGQAMDIAWHRDFHSLPSLDEYDRMCRLKTGCLAKFAAILGVYCSCMGQQDSGEPRIREELAKTFGDAAEQLGVGFQILDDVKNLSTGVPGKKRGDDIVEGKKSLPVLLYLHRYPEKREFIARCFTQARASGLMVPEVEEMIDALEKTGILEEARKKGLDYIRESSRIFSAPDIAGFPLKSEGQKLLSGLMETLS